MGQGGYITLVNGTPYAWTKTNQHSYQMNSWSFPDSIAPFSNQRIYVEWDQSIIHNTSDDGGEANYSIEGASSAFQIQARASSGFQLQVVFTQLAAYNQPAGSTLSLGWVHDGSVQFILAGQAGAFISNAPPTAWMQNQLSVLGSRPLRHLCMPGAHDAGMSTLSGGTAGAFACNIVTQTRDIAGQLQAGARYFDIRPVIASGRYLTGHYSDTGTAVGWQGGNGQAISDIINDINTFLASNAELVILNLSHDVNTDVGEPNYRALNQAEWNALLGQLSALKGLYICPEIANLDLSLKTLGDFIGQGASAVVVIAQPSDNTISLGSYAGQGFYPNDSFPLYNSYSNANDVGTMSADQLRKMRQQRPSPDAEPFLLSWTLTQNATQAVTCVSGVSSSILQLADTANPAIYDALLSACTSQCYPNVLYTDDLSNPTITALAMAINNIAQ